MEPKIRQKIDAVLEIDLFSAEDKAPSLLAVSSFLFDFNFAYEVSRIVSDPNYEGFHFSPFIYFRNRRPLKPEDRLVVDHLSHHSPLELVTILAAVPSAVASCWGIIQVVERLYNSKL